MKSAVKLGIYSLLINHTALLGIVRYIIYKKRKNGNSRKSRTDVSWFVFALSVIKASFLTGLTK